MSVARRDRHEDRSCGARTSARLVTLVGTGYTCDGIVRVRFGRIDGSDTSSVGCCSLLSPRNFEKSIERFGNRIEAHNATIVVEKMARTKRYDDAVANISLIIPMLDKRMTRAAPRRAFHVFSSPSPSSPAASIDETVAS